ncbi:UV radiation resistance protein and autophagy-related subunit 14-domain-containing protein [Crepidotus variabilis]|uniref:Autophagy-related protein 14 n=1 Tax=Crepidotus variabilis TaxID=179855 RepID=A0A9P6JR61_9AGAR|nr:UV radiation resistance protein and autophagy-related subunit 14-domain-containing protein [Crepidotus variabilis]
MDCRICELRHRQFICETCLKTHLHDLRQQTQYYSSDRDEQVVKATRALSDVIMPARTTRGAHAAVQHQVEQLQCGLVKLRKDNEKKREQLRLLRETLSSRRRNLSTAKLHTSSVLNPSAHSPPLASTREASSLTNLSAEISRARAGLVQELVEVFNIVEVGGRPPIGGKAGTKGEWTIGDLILPVPGDMRRYPPDHINAVLTHTIHFLSLLTFYLGIKLPFEIIWSGGKLGVGQPLIGAIKGTETGGWARWHTKHPLHLSSSPSPAHVVPSPSALDKLSDPAPLSSSVLAAAPPPSAPQSSFTTALAMLLYNVSFLAYTQNVEVPLSQTGDVLSNLWMVCCSAELGRKSHETYPHLPAPTPPSFPLDFSQLLQATVANPASKSRRPVISRSSKAISQPGQHDGRHIDLTVLEEDDGWDMVDDDV